VLVNGFDSAVFGDVMVHSQDFLTALAFPSVGCIVQFFKRIVGLIIVIIIIIMIRIVYPNGVMCRLQ